MMQFLLFWSKYQNLKVSIELKNSWKQVRTNLVRFYINSILKGLLRRKNGQDKKVAEKTTFSKNQAKLESFLEKKV